MIPASIRNRNPLAQYPGPSAKKFGSTSYETLRSKDGVHKIATFPSSIQGAAAAFDLLATSKNYKGKPLRSVIKTWCGDYHLESYIAMVTTHCDLKADDVLTAEVIRDPSKAIPLAQAMALQEAGTVYPMTDEEWLEAHELAFADPVLAAWSPTNATPSRNPEDKRDDVVRIGKQVAAGAGGTAAAAGGVQQFLQGSAAPTVHKSLEKAQATRQTATAVKEEVSAWSGMAKDAHALVGLPGLILCCVAVLVFLAGHYLLKGRSA